jgi:GNAT superfamily N-acetyltransferase
MTELTYPFADLELARRLEKAEARGNREFVEARAIADPDRGAKWIEVGGTFAMFDGVGSPLTQTFGLGIAQAISSEEMDEIEQFFQERGSDVFHEVCPLSDESARSLLNERGYKTIESSSVLYRPISTDFRLPIQPNEQVHARPLQPGEEQRWTDTAFKGWSEFAELGDFLREMGQVQAHSKSISFIAELNGESIATGVLIIDKDVALLAGASTVPEARRQGAQLALLDARLRYAASLGCTIGMMVANPGSGSQRNAERHGFRIAYTRTKWQLKTS